MAWLEQKSNGNYHIVFRLGSDKYRRSLKTKTNREALSRKLRIEENIKLVESGRLTVPKDADLVSFLLSDGKLDKPIAAQKRLALGQLYEAYTSSLPADSIEAGTLSTASIHMRHLARILGGKTQLQAITTSELQRYVNQRSKEPGHRGGCVRATTIKKELATFRTLWNWAMIGGYTSSPFPLRGVIYPKHHERQPFRTRDEIERQIAGNNLDRGGQSELWECLYLRVSEIREVLATIEQQSNYPHIYPMAAVAAFTGARRSEICRMLATDIELDRGVIMLRENKRNKSKRTFRQIPIATELAPILEDWISSKPLGAAAFPTNRSSNRLGQRIPLGSAVTTLEATDNLEQALSKSPWSIMNGWHVFRHSFISNCASRGIDQRMIDDWVGHQTDEQRRRYRHLFPESQRQAIDQVF